MSSCKAPKKRRKRKRKMRTLVMAARSCWVINGEVISNPDNRVLRIRIRKSATARKVK